MQVLENKRKQAKTYSLFFFIIKFVETFFNMNDRQILNIILIVVVLSFVTILLTHYKRIGTTVGLVKQKN